MRRRLHMDDVLPTMNEISMKSKPLQPHVRIPGAGELCMKRDLFEIITETDIR